MKESIIVIRGPIGVGKSSVAQALHQKMSERASLIEPDAIKRMIDPIQSSAWRREVAHNSALFLVDQILKVPRSVVVEAHTKYPEMLGRYQTIAAKNNAFCVNVLLTAPLEVCLARADQRHIPGIDYRVDHAMVEDYYCNLEPGQHDLVFDTSKQSCTFISEAVLEVLDQNIGNAALLPHARSLT
jgi:predicted ABC-type ATPase